MNNYKIKVNNEAESKEAQELFEQLGFNWASDYPENGEWYSHLYAENSTCCHLPIYVWNGLGDKFKELTLPQLRDLVVLHRNDVKDANWVTEGDDQIYKDSSGKSFIFRKQGWDELQRHEMRQAMWEKVKPKPQPTEAEQGLISGADALKAMMEGKRVLYSGYKNQDWDTALNCNLGVFLKHEKFPDFSFKIVPRTIKLELEIPACGRNYKHGQFIWILNSLEPNEYCSVILDESDELPAYWWETEEEIKQVVAALRGIKG
ncbi:hypothetical protein [Acinetobacter sp. 102]|uniref:hypothetical protein n=1 Tax=Acinetobacter sp. 102 TaxID=3098766 RepID=UPI003009DB72